MSIILYIPAVLSHIFFSWAVLHLTGPSLEYKCFLKKSLSLNIASYSHRPSSLVVFDKIAVYILLCRGCVPRTAWIKYENNFLLLASHLNVQCTFKNCKNLFKINKFFNFLKSLFLFYTYWYFIKILVRYAATFIHENFFVFCSVYTSRRHSIWSSSNDCRHKL